MIYSTGHIPRVHKTKDMHDRTEANKTQNKTSVNFDLAKDWEARHMGPHYFKADI